MKTGTVCEFDDVVQAYSIYCPELPGLVSCGDTVEDAQRNFKDAASLFFSPDSQEFPSSSIVSTITV